MKRRVALHFGAFFLIAAAGFGSAFAQKADAKSGSAKVVEKKLASKLMDREMPYRVILPANYDAETGVRFPVIYLLHGLSGHYDNWTDKTKIAEFALNHQYILVTPEGGDGWYTDSASDPKEKYESYIVKELIPTVDKEFRTKADRKHRAVAGLSMGGYGSLKFGLKYPEMFALVGSFSGALEAAKFTEKNAGNIGKTTDLIFGTEGGESRMQNDIYLIVKDLSSNAVEKLPFIYLDCGTEDFLFASNRSFVALLTEKKIPHEYRELPGGHTWPYWNAQVKEFLEVADIRLEK